MGYWSPWEDTGPMPFRPTSFCVRTLNPRAVSLLNPYGPTRRFLGIVISMVTTLITLLRVLITLYNYPNEPSSSSPKPETRNPKP